MTSCTANNTALPQGFSIYQPALGAQLQFFPAVGSQELDDLVHAYLPGAAASSEKRASLALDFFEHAQMTGQTFKFYPVFSMAAAAAAVSPATSASSSFNVSPINPTWDFSQASRTPSISSHASSHRLSKPTSPASRGARATDFSALPGMKIMTRDGRDVTNSASRGSKTKEQRDHAHLMRIIKACDACRKKKIRCDPSHKKRAVAQAAAAQATAAAAKPQTKKARTSPLPQPPTQPRSVSPQSISPASVSPPVMIDDMAVSGSPFDFEASNLSFDSFDALVPAADGSNLWDEFVQYPPMDLSDDYDFFTDPESYFSSSQPSDSVTSADGSIANRHLAAASERGLEVRSGGSPTTDSPQLPYLDQSGSGSGSDYADFNLYSPGSTFSEDDRMLQVSSRPSPLSSLNDQQSPDHAGGLEERDPATQLDTRRAQQQDERDCGPDLTQLPPLRQDRVRSSTLDAEAVNTTTAPRAINRSDITMTTNEQGQLVICCPPGTVVVTNSGRAGRSGEDATPSTDLHSSVFGATDLSESAVAGVPANTADVESAIGSWLDQRQDETFLQQQQQLVRNADSEDALKQTAEGLDAYQTSRFVHRNTGSVRSTMLGGVTAPESPGAIVAQGALEASAAPVATATLSAGSLHLSAVDVSGSYASDQAGVGRQDVSGGLSARDEASPQLQAQPQAAQQGESVVAASSASQDGSSGVGLDTLSVPSRKDVTAIGRAAEQSQDQEQGQLSDQVDPAALSELMQCVITQVIAAACMDLFSASTSATREVMPVGRPVRAVRACRGATRVSSMYLSPLPAMGRAIAC